jgi:LysR family transcriptional activator of nhaA
VQPKVVAEFEDTALLNVCGQEGLGFFPGHDAIAGEITRKFRVRQLGVASKVRQSFYAISVERRLRHPAVVALIEAARSSVFSAGKQRQPRAGGGPSS